MSELLEKVLLGLKCCLPQTDEEAEIGCDQCPYNDNCGDAGNDVMLRTTLVEDIRKLLEEQQPRVLTLGEACEADVCWIEVKGSDRITPGRIGNHGGEEIFSIRRFDALDETFTAPEHGTEIRFWSARPTEEQRRKTEWQQ